MIRILTSALACLTLAAAAQAQVQVGQKAPNFEASFSRVEASSMADLKGRVVLLEFWRTW